MDALAAAPRSAQLLIFARMEELEAQKNDLQIDAAKLRVAMKIRLTEEEVLSWLKEFCGGDPLDPEFRGRIIDTFINSVYLYDDRVIIFYNIQGGKQVSCIELSNELEEQFPGEPPDPSGFEHDRICSTSPEILILQGFPDFLLQHGGTIWGFLQKICKKMIFQVP